MGESGRCVAQGDPPGKLVAGVAGVAHGSGRDLVGRSSDFQSEPGVSIFVGHVSRWPSIVPAMDDRPRQTCYNDGGLRLQQTSIRDDGERR